MLRGAQLLPGVHLTAEGRSASISTSVSFPPGSLSRTRAYQTSPRPLPWLGLFYNDSMMRPPR